MSKKSQAKIFIIVLFLFALSILLVNNMSNKNNYIKDHEVLHDDNKTIVVLGSEPESITAAVTAARLGYSVKLITEDETLGGLFTEGMLTALDLNYTDDKKILHKGFFSEFYDNASNGYNLDLQKTQDFFNNVTKHKNIQIIKSAKDIKPIVDDENNKKVLGVSYKQNNKKVNLKSDFILDGSDEAEFTRKIGAMYRVGRSEFGQPQDYAAAGIMFSVDGVNWNKLKKAIKRSNDPDTGVSGNAAWGFKEMYNYVPKNDMFKMRGLNISRQDNDSIVLNALLVLGVDPLDEKSYKNAIELSKQEIPHIVDYMKKNLPGFENATLDKIADELYIREGVRVVCDKTLNGYDIIAHTKFNDVIGYGSYPSDLQTTHKSGYGNAMNGRSLYEVPLSSMIPKFIDNVVVLGRNASFDVVAHGSARTVPVLMSMAQGAVHAIDYALTNNLDLREVRDNHMQEVHKLMQEEGKMYMPDMPPNPYEGHFAEKYIKHLRIRGVLSSKYTKEIPLDEAASLDEARSIINLMMDHSEIRFTAQQIESIKHINNEITEKDLIYFVSILIDRPIATLEEIKNEGIISEELYNNIKSSNEIKNSHIYGVLSEYINYIQPYLIEQIKEDKVDVLTMK